MGLSSTVHLKDHDSTLIFSVEELRSTSVGRRNFTKVRAPDLIGKSPTPALDYID